MAKLSNNDLTLKVGFDIDKFTNELQKTTGVLNKWGNNVKNSLLGISAGFSVLAIGRHVITSLAGFEHAMSEVKAITQSSDIEFQKLRDNALELGAATKFTAQEVAGLQTAYGRLGFTADEILNVTGATIALATATGEDLAKSADVAGSTLRAFNLDADQMQRVVDVMASSFNKSALGLENFSESMKYVAPVANAAGLSIEQTTAMLGVLADAGIRGSMVGTSLRKIISDLGKGAAPELSKALAEMASKGLTGAAAMDEVGRTAYASLLILANHTQGIDSATEAYKKANGEAQKMADIMSDDLTGDWIKFTSAVDGAIQKGSGLNNLFRSLTQTATNAIRTITGDGELNHIIKTVDGGAEGMKPYVDLIKQFGAEMHTKVLPALKSENYWKEKLKALNEAALGQVGSLRAATNNEIKDIQAKIKSLQDLGKTKAELQRIDEAKYGIASDPTETEGGDPFASSFSTLFGKQLAEDTKNVADAINQKADADLYAADASEKHSRKMMQMMQIGEAFGANFGEMASGAIKFADGMRNMANDVVNELYRIAQMQIIAKSASLGPIGLIAASAGLAALRGLVGGLLSSSGGGGGGSYSGSENNYTRAADRQSVHVTVEGVVRGNNLVLVQRNALYSNSKLGG